MGQAVGQALDEGDELMASDPPKIVERLLSLLLPPACREEVMGDMYESCDSLGEYIRQAIRVVPMVIFSRMRRTADAQVLLMQSAALYLSFLAAAWSQGKTFLVQNSGLMKLAIPCAWAVFGLVLAD